MTKVSLAICAGLVLFSAQAHANLCDSVKDAATTDETKRDVGFYQQLFPDAAYHGNRGWNEMVLQCNRQRDTKGNEIAKVTASASAHADQAVLKAKDLDAKIVRGHYNFFGTLVTQLKYVYVLSKKDGVWTMVIPYKPVFNELVADRVDFEVGSRDVNTKTNTVSAVSTDGHAWSLYDASQIVTKRDSSGAQVIALKDSPQPIAKTLCSSSTYFPGDAGKYDGQNDAFAYKRDPENKFISLGRIQYRYKDQDWMQEGCRVAKDRDLFWLDPVSKEVVKVKPQDWILDNFVRSAQSYWSIPGKFELKLLLVGRNEASFPKATLAALADDDYLTVRFATKFLPYHYNQMYKSNIIQFNNFSTMTSDGTYRHEVGHAFGLDDEYGGSKEDDKTGDTLYKQNSCKNGGYARFSPTEYQMCEAGVSEVRSIYHYLAVSRYITKQNECSRDTDCASGEYCNAGIDLSKNQCVAKKADNETCDLANGARQCSSGKCNLGRCYTPSSVAMGGTCYCDDACKEGKCSAIDGTKGSCVCKTDGDCGPGKYCDGGVDFKINTCKSKLASGEKCGKAGSIGNDHKCQSGECSGFPKYECK
jgi:hypothetical protein